MEREESQHPLNETNTVNEEHTQPLLWRIAPDLLAFVGGLGTAYALHWKTTDLVWSLWLSSLVIGYTTILSAIAAGAYIGINLLRHKSVTNKQRAIGVLIGLAAGGFLLGFFSLHFCGFHAGHSVFLNAFFPIEGMPKMGFGDAFTNPPLLWYMAFKHLMIPYGLFLIPALIAERKYVFKPLIDAVRVVRENPLPDDFTKEGFEDHMKGKKINPIGDAMGRPYLNVVRMHLLIFFFAFCYFLKVESFLVYAVVYSVYFFPWREFKGYYMSDEEKAAEGA